MSARRKCQTPVHLAHEVYDMAQQVKDAAEELHGEGLNPGYGVSTESAAELALAVELLNRTRPLIESAAKREVERYQEYTETLQG